MEKDRASIISAIIIFKEIGTDLNQIGKDLLDSGVDYRFVKRLQTIIIKLDELYSDMKGELK